MPTPSPLALVVEDAPEFVALVTRLLEREGFEVHVATTGEAALVHARSHDPDLVVLDVQLPDLDGFEVCRRLREFSDTYVVMLTARDEEIDKVVGLTVGADDYVTKPFSPRELTARVKAMLRRPRVRQDPQVRRFGTLEVDPVARVVAVSGEEVALTRIEFDILSLLTGRPRQTFERVQVLDAVWGDAWFGDDHVIDVHLGNLRRKLREAQAPDDLIRTVRGVGYRFDPPREG